jgi:hypothetical protein
MGERRLGGVQNVNFLAIFWHFPNPHINWDQKSLEEQGKVEKLQNGSPGIIEQFCNKESS